MVACDFNCKFDSKFYDVFCKFLIDQQLICVDLLKLHGVHTFVISDDGQRRSWIDHVVRSRPLMSYFGGIKVLNGTIS